MEKIYASFSWIVLCRIFSWIDHIEKTIKNVPYISSTCNRIVRDGTHDELNQLRHVYSLSRSRQLRKWFRIRVLKHVSVLERQEIPGGKLVGQRAKVSRMDRQNFILFCAVCLSSERNRSSLRHRIIDPHVRMGYFCNNERRSDALRVRLHS